MTPAHVPIDRASRGRLRLWKRATAARYERIAATLDGKPFAAAARDYNYKRGKGRARALAKLKVLLAEAHLETSDDDYALWSYLHPRDSVVTPNPGVGPSELQDCVCVDFVVVGQTWDYRHSRVTRGRGNGLWSFEASDHALGRALQRDPAADLDPMLLSAHHAALAAAPATSTFLLPAGQGAFKCTLRAGPDTDTGKHCTWITAHTWIHADQMADGQVCAGRAELPAARLGSSVLLPMALRHLATLEARP
jgi:hypothetical protein